MGLYESSEYTAERFRTTFAIKHEHYEEMGSNTIDVASFYIATCKQSCRCIGCHKDVPIGCKVFLYLGYFGLDDVFIKCLDCVDETGWPDSFYEILPQLRKECQQLDCYAWHLTKGVV